MLDNKIKEFNVDQYLKKVDDSRLKKYKLNLPVEKLLPIPKSNNILLTTNLKVDILIINKKYKYLNLSEFKCSYLIYKHQAKNSIKNHILPNNLIALDIKNSSITKLPLLPNKIFELDISNNPMLDVDEIIFPENLQILNLSNMNLEYIPDNLPKNICGLVLSDNRIKILGNLPENIYTLDISNNLIENIDKVSNNIEYLYCSDNKIKEINNLPEKLNLLDCSSNKLVHISYLPESLKNFTCNFNPGLGVLPDFPVGLGRLCLYGLKLKYLPKLPKYCSVFCFLETDYIIPTKYDIIIHDMRLKENKHNIIVENNKNYKLLCDKYISDDIYLKIENDIKNSYSKNHKLNFNDSSEESLSEDDHGSDLSDFERYSESSSCDCDFYKSY